MNFPFFHFWAGVDCWIFFLRLKLGLSLAIWNSLRLFTPFKNRYIIMVSRDQQIIWAISNKYIKQMEKQHLLNIYSRGHIIIYSSQVIFIKKKKKKKKKSAFILFLNKPAFWFKVCFSLIKVSFFFFLLQHSLVPEYYYNRL